MGDKLNGFNDGLHPSSGVGGKKGALDLDNIIRLDISKLPEGWSTQESIDYLKTHGHIVYDSNNEYYFKGAIKHEIGIEPESIDLAEMTEEEKEKIYKNLEDIREKG